MDNRIIKFRAWDKEKKIMLLPEPSRFLTSGNVVLHTMRSFDELQPEETYLDRTESLIPMQFTGLLDKNGKEIYEGDLIHLDEGEAVNIGNLSIVSGAGGKTYEVFWYQLGWALRVVGEKDEHGLGTGLSLSAYGANEYGRNLKDGEQSDTIAVIGNVYENPDLLK